MSSTFTCLPLSNTKQQNVCMFEGVSQCRDHVSQVICNAHALLFGLINKPTHYHNGDNDVYSKIVTYAAASNNINIPLFMDSNNKILMSEIRAFARNIGSNFSSINSAVFEERIACLMGLNMVPNQPLCRNTWFDDPGSAIIIRNSDAQIQYFNELPHMHKALFQYVSASNIRSAQSDTETYLIVNLSLTRNDSEDKYAFVTPNKATLLKYTDRPGCVATPLVMDAIQSVLHSTADRVFKPIYDYAC